jgi:hypothetical protein
VLGRPKNGQTAIPSVRRGHEVQSAVWRRGEELERESRRLTCAFVCGDRRFQPA